MTEALTVQDPNGPERSLWQRVNDNFDERLTQLVARANLDASNPGVKKQMAMTLGIVGGVATLFLAPELAGNVIHTIQEHGANYVHPGWGEFIGIEAAAGYAGTKIGPKLAGN